MLPSLPGSKYFALNWLLALKVAEYAIGVHYLTLDHMVRQLQTGKPAVKVCFPLKKPLCLLGNFQVIPGDGLWS